MIYDDEDEDEEDDEEDEDEEEEDEDEEGEDRSHGLSVCSFDVLSPHCSPLCILYLSYYTLYTYYTPPRWDYCRVLCTVHCVRTVYTIQTILCILVYYTLFTLHTTLLPAGTNVSCPTNPALATKHL